MTDRLAIFDLDGTILDTLEDLLDAMNASLAEFGFPGHTLAEMRTYIGNGLKMMAVRAVPEGTDNETVEKVYRYFKSYYAQHLNIKTAPYPGITDMLRKLRANGIHTAVSTNKFDRGAKELIRAHFGDLIEYTLGETEGTPRKPDPAGPIKILNFFGAKPEDTLYIGDSSVDIQTAENAGLGCVSVSWGFQDRERLVSSGAARIADTVNELEEAVMSFGSVIAMGMFDGLHKGHRAVIDAAKACADELSRPLAVYTFIENPKSLFGGIPFDIQSFEEKTSGLKALGVQHIFSRHFTREFASISPDDFLNGFFAKYRPKAIVAGADYTFGDRASGTTELLKEFGRLHNIKVIIVPLVMDGGEKISSTRIRRAISEGNTLAADKMK